MQTLSSIATSAESPWPGILIDAHGQEIWASPGVAVIPHWHCRGVHVACWFLERFDVSSAIVTEISGCHPPSHCRRPEDDVDGEGQDDDKVKLMPFVEVGFQARMPWKTHSPQDFMGMVAVAASPVALGWSRRGAFLTC